MRTRNWIITTAIVVLISSTVTLGASGATSKAGKQYLRDVHNYKVGVLPFVQRANKWNSSTTDAQAYSDAKPAIRALSQFQKSLLTQKWPKKVQSAIFTLYSDVAPLIGDLNALQTVDILNISSWATKWQSDGAIVSSQSNLVRHLLGLPLNAKS